MKCILLSLLAALTIISLPAGAGAQVNPLEQVCDNTNTVNTNDTSDASVCNATSDDPISGDGGIILRVVEIMSFVTGALV